MLTIKVFFPFGNKIELRVSNTNEAKEYIDKLKRDLGLNELEYQFEYRTENEIDNMQLDVIDKMSQVTGETYH